MNVINIIGAANKLNDKQIELLKEIFVKVNIAHINYQVDS